MNKLLLTSVFIVLLQLTGYSQSTPTNKVKTDTSAKKGMTQPQPKEEVKDGIWEVGEYLGKKLADELGDRMNLGETTEPEPRKPKKVTLKIGPIKIERYE